MLPLLRSACPTLLSYCGDEDDGGGDDGGDGGGGGDEKVDEDIGGN